MTSARSPDTNLQALQEKSSPDHHWHTTDVTCQTTVHYDDLQPQPYTDHAGFWVLFREERWGKADCRILSLVSLSPLAVLGAVQITPTFRPFRIDLCRQYGRIKLPHAFENP